uniref:Uncharacterized protein n=1 Tax=Ciona savignyi TaxID=51511 RepID=H2ZEL2_CIOSA
MEHTKRAKSKTQSASSSSKLTDKSKSKKNTWTRMFKKAASAQQLTGANPPTPTPQQTPQTPQQAPQTPQTPQTPKTPHTPIQKRPPQPIPRAVKDASPDKTNSIAIHNPSFQTISPGKEDNPPSRKVEVVNEPPLVPEKTRASVLSNGSEDVFNDNAELSHYQSPTAIHEKFPSLNNCCAYASTTSNEAAPCYDCPKSASMCDVVPLAPHDSFKVSINPTLIDNGSNENDGFYDVPSSPQFDIQPQSTTLYDIPKNSRGDSNTSTNTEDSYCSMVSVKPRTKKQQKSKHSSRKDEPSVYTSMKLSGTQYENMSYGMKR